MNAIVNIGPDQLAWQERPLPEPGPGAVRIRVAACGICGTDLEMIRGWKRTAFPSVPGHEWSGTVDALGPGVAPALLGQPCVADNIQPDGGEVGFEHPGGFGEYLITQAANLRTLPADFPLHKAALAEPLAVCLRAMKRLEMSDRRAAVIFGDGTIGLMMLLLLRAAGVADLTVVGGRTGRLKLAAELGAARTLDHRTTDDLAGMVIKLAGRVPNVIEASGAAQAVAAGVQIAAHSGRILLIGDYGENHAAFRWNHVLHQELRLIGTNASRGAWDDAARILSADELQLERLISRRIPARDFPQAFDLLRHGDDVVKVILDWTL